MHLFLTMCSIVFGAYIFMNSIRFLFEGPFIFGVIGFVILFIYIKIVKNKLFKEDK
jgi:hypothetical protein